MGQVDVLGLPDGIGRQVCCPRCKTERHQWRPIISLITIVAIASRAINVRS